MRELGFTVDPERLKRLPASESFVFTIVYQANQSINTDTKVEAVLPLSIVGGPTFHIMIVCGLCVSSSYDFF